MIDKLLKNQGADSVKVKLPDKTNIRNLSPYVDLFDVEYAERAFFNIKKIIRE